LLLRTALVKIYVQDLKLAGDNKNAN